MPPDPGGAIASGRPRSHFVLTLSLIGIGCGDPEQLTLAAVRAINAADLILIPRKGEEKSDLAELRREICARVLTNGNTRLVEFDLPRARCRQRRLSRRRR